jgi:uncharacterized protein YndB with AHSA1/START domain
MPAMREYEFKTVWVLDATIEAVWDAIAASERWPEWWPYLESVVEISRGDNCGIGSIRRYTWGCSLPYRLDFQVTVTRIERPVIIEGVASGDLEGVGRWILSAEGETSTRVEYLLSARSTKPWMNMAAPFLSWFFRWNHNRVMDAGREGLKNYLHCMENGSPGRG